MSENFETLLFAFGVPAQRPGIVRDTFVEKETTGAEDPIEPKNGGEPDPIAVPDILNQLGATVERLRRAYAPYQEGGVLLLGKNHIITCEGMPFAFDVEWEHGTGNAINLRSARPVLSIDATRFTEGEAEIIASKLSNDRGAPAEATYLIDALADDISKREALIDGLTFIHAL